MAQRRSGSQAGSQARTRARTRVGVVVCSGAAILLLVAASLLLGRLVAPSLAGLASGVRHGGVRTLAGLPFEVLLTQLCAVLLAACWCWLCLTAGAVLVVAVRGHATAPVAALARLCPGVLRSALLGVCGLGIGLAAVVPAYADAGGLDGLTLPDRMDGHVSHGLVSHGLVSHGLDGQRPDRTSPMRSARAVTVRLGDSLWAIAARALPPGTDDATVTLAWHQIHHHNRAVLGADPDLILRGTVLLLPHDLGLVDTSLGREPR